MNRESYLEKLKKPAWQKKRLAVLEYANWRCQICGDKSTCLHVHHSYYTKGKEPWQYPTGSMICLCEFCHLKLHPKKNPIDASISPYLPPMPPQDGDDKIPEQEVIAAEFAKLRAKLIADQSAEKEKS